MSNASGIKSIAVVGAGLMGSGIAESAAIAGVPVVLRDVDEVSIGRAQGRIESSLARAVKGGKL
ncbi:MAG: 3-hydroxyacyl-CoA dehydrogenase NAD-binding domain-containing protein, partial [Solirubrobacteraceae bacterium]